MAAASNWGITPPECRAGVRGVRGESVVIDACIDLLSGATNIDPTLIYALGGPPARWAVSGGDGGPDYWLRVWAARGLLWAWNDYAAPAVEDALDDPAWRVRESAAKVAAKHRLGDALPTLVRLRNTDPNHRVAAAAERAIARIVATNG